MEASFIISNRQKNILEKEGGFLKNERYNNQAVEILEEGVNKLNHLISSANSGNGRVEYRLRMVDPKGQQIGEVEVPCASYDDHAKLVKEAVARTVIGGPVDAIEATATFTPDGGGIVRTMDSTMRLPLGWKSDYKSA